MLTAVKKLRVLIAVAMCALVVVPGVAHAGSFTRWLKNLISSKPRFEFLPPSGSGAPVAASVCDNLSTDDKSGDWWCLKGDGTMASGSALTLSAVGTPTTQTRALCPNGLSCDSATVGRTNGTSQYWATGSTAASPTGDFSACWVGQVDTVGGTTEVLMAMDDGASGRVWIINDQLDVYVFKSAGSFSSVTGNDAISRAEHVVCMVYDYVADGTSVLRLYVDGVEDGTAVTTAVGPPTSANGYVSVNARKTGAGTADFFTSGNTRGAFFTHKALSATDVLRISQATQGKLTGTKGETITTTRASPMFCEDGSGEGTWLPANKPCVAQGGLISEPSSINLALYSEDFSNAAWTKSNVTVTTNTAAAPDGRTTLDTLAGTANGAYVVAAAGQAATQTWMTLSVWAKTSAGTQDFTLRMYNNTTAGYVATCNKTATTTLTRFECTATSGIAAGQSIFPSIWPGGVSGTGTIIAGWTVMEAQPYATSYIQTEGSTVQREANVSYATVAAIAPRSMSVEVEVRDIIPRGSTTAVWAYQDADNALSIAKDSTAYTVNQQMECRVWGNPTIHSGVPEQYLPDLGASGRWHQQSCDYTASDSIINGHKGNFVSTALAVALPTSVTRIYLGGAEPSNYQWGFPIRNVCVDHRYGKCRPSSYNTDGNPVAWLGDSITFGYAATTSRPPHVLGDSLDRPVYNHGINGHTAAQCLSRWRDDIRGKGYTTLVLLCGVNSVIASTDAATIFADLQTIMDEARADGMTVIPVTMLPFKSAAQWSAGKQTILETVNTSIRNYCTANSLTCVDAYANMGDADPAVLLAAYDSGDGLHPNAAGSTQLAALVQAASP